MSKEQKGQVAALTAKLESAYTSIKRLEADLSKAQKRLHTKSQEVAAARRARQEALTLLGMALAEDSSLREKVTTLLAEDAEREANIGREAAFVAAQMTMLDDQPEA
jgi:phosphoenolpyruvate-protein kinase (PTS system EI component)